MNVTNMGTSQSKARESSVEMTFDKMLSQSERRPLESMSLEAIAGLVGVAVRLPGIFAAMYDSDGLYRWVCASFGAELGIDASRLVGRRIRDLFSEAWSSERLAVLGRALESGGAVPVVEIFRGRRVEGVVVPVPSARPQASVVYLGKFVSATRPVHTAPNGLQVVQLEHADWGPLAVLSRRELEVLRLIAIGLENDEIAAKLHRTKRAVEWHIKHLYDNLQCRNRAELLRYGTEAGLVGIDDSHWERMVADHKIPVGREGEEA